MNTMKIAAACLFIAAVAGCANNEAQPPATAPVAQPQTAAEPEGVVYCGGGEIKRQIAYVILDDATDQWNARVTVNGDTQRAMTSYSFFGNTEPPKGFQVAILGEDRAEYLVFEDGSDRWIEFGDYRYQQCN